MGFQLLISVLLVSSFYAHYGDSDSEFISVRDFLSDSGNTNADQSQAIQDAWKALCAGKSKSLVIHANEVYTLLPQVFQGPCVASNPHIQIDGKIEAPKLVKDWGSNKPENWLSFDKVSGLTITGSGLLDPHGESWWSTVKFDSRPQALQFNRCNNLIYNGLTQRNSPKNHISISNCIQATLSNLHLIAPANSPNTDGIDISLSQQINIFSSAIQTGSLGEGGATETVENVHVQHCTFTGADNAARIKTWPGSAVKVSDVTFRYFRGTCAQPIAIKLDCDKIGCGNIVLEHINITSSSPQTSPSAICRFADVTSSFVNIDMKCVNHADLQGPSPSPELPSQYDQPHAQLPQASAPHAQARPFLSFL
uniref:Polygalacturonase n=1 Tax=Brassica campestris TaxID=3711 RepID=M4FG52_BRACM